MHPAYILCGGRSSRFGSDKARVLNDRQPQLLNLRNQLLRSGHEVHFVADRAERYSDLGIECLVDTQPDCGPLAGLSCALAHRAHSALARATPTDRDAGWLLLVSCDLARWECAWYARLLRCSASVVRHDKSSNEVKLCRPQLSAVAWFDTRWQPLPGLYHIDLLSGVQQRLRDGRLSLHDLLMTLEASGQCAPVTDAHSPRAWSFNTPDELADLPRS